MKKLMLACSDFRYSVTIHTRTISRSLSASYTFFSIVRILLIAALLFFSLFVFAQTENVQDAAYRKTLTERSAKIVNTLGITDSGTYNKVLNVLVDQYAGVNIIHDQNKAALSEIKKQTLSESEKTELVKKQETKKSSELLQLHEQFIAHLKKNLNADQIEKVKDGMTYRVFPVTYAAFLDMIPNLTAVQKDKIYNWLKEARELAMDEGSSEDKHKVFGKYKGRINNYLSAEGYDLKKETADWQARIKERELQKKGQTN